MNGRYVLDQMLGQGGMGQVFTARDRLTGQRVALKRVHIRALASAAKPARSEALVATVGWSDRSDLDTAKRSLPHLRTVTGATQAATQQPTHLEVEALRLALAREFRLLASLRHPHIITVIDFGFDAQQQPYFTMELLENAESLGEVCSRLDLVTRVRLLLQIVAALGYLHRRGILHLDLKPGNVLVTGGPQSPQAKVLDFGLSTIRSRLKERTMAVGGTLGYIPPEILLGEAPTEASDLFSFGVLAYEVLVGETPFPAANTTGLLSFALSTEIDLSKLTLSVPLRRVLQRLLQRNLADRYQHAQDVAKDLEAAVDLEGSSESEAYIDNELQTLALVGRDRELATLRSALADCLASSGGLFLVGGESGAGKTRLLEELRILALVNGAGVHFGQGALGGGAYQILLDVVRQLLLVSPPSGADASVLASLIPDLPELLDITIEPAPGLDASAARERLLATVERLFLSIKQPTVVLLDDIQWAAEESLSVLARVSEKLRAIPLLIVAGFRDDEAPGLPAQLPGSRLLSIKRLETHSVEQLVGSLLGPSTHRQELVRLLLRETEGNPFFITEVLRALAKEAGGLAQLQGARLPDQIMTGGVRTILQRRLARVPEAARQMLKVAAVVGRQIDVELLGYVSSDVTSWLSICMESSVLDVANDRFRFAHDKLREAILADLAPAERRQLHQLVAGVLTSHLQHRPQTAAALAFHFEQAGELRKAAEYALRGGEESFAIGALAEACVLLKRAVALQAQHGNFDALVLAKTHRLLAESLLALGQIDASMAHSGEGLRTLQYPMVAQTLAGSQALLGSFAAQVQKRVLTWGFGRKTESVETPAERERLNILYGLLSSYGEASLYFCSELSLFHCALGCANIADRTGEASQQIFSYGAMAYSASAIPLDGVATRYLDQAEAALARAPSLFGQRQLLRLSCAVHINRGRFAEALRVASRGIAVCQEASDVFGHMFIQQMVAWIYLFTGKSEQAAHICDALRELAEQSHNRQFLGWAYAMHGLAMRQLGNRSLAISDFRNALPLTRAAADSLSQRFALAHFALCAAENEESSLSCEYLDAALGLIEKSPILAYATLHSVQACVETCQRLLQQTHPVVHASLKQRLKNALSAQQRLGTRLVIGKSAMLRNQGDVAAAEGLRDKASALYTESLSVALSLGMAEDEERSQQALLRLDTAHGTAEGRHRLSAFVRRVTPELKARYAAQLDDWMK